jgi:galactokinase
MNQSFKARAHGRVNLIGEHTDYNLGFVLPTTIPQFTEVTIELHSDLIVDLYSGSASPLEAPRDFTYLLGQEKKLGQWSDYLAGTTAILRQEGHKLTGMDVTIESTVPEGSGLSSSAALEIAFLKALRETFSLPLTDLQLAQLGQRIENEFVGARVGIMDQMACALARAGEALFLDTQSMSYEQVSLPLKHLDVLVINSGISHRHAGGGYNERRQECEDACAQLGVSSLRELNLEDLQKLSALPELLARRARHVVTENDRVIQAVKAIREHNLANLGELFQASHRSMRDDYEVSVPEIDALVKLLNHTRGVYGARLTGGGFGGSVVAITEKNLAREIASAVLPQYEKEARQMGTVLCG